MTGETPDMELLKWRRSLPQLALMDLVGEYRKGSQDPAAKDAWDEFQFRMMSGAIKPKRSSVRCGMHSQKRNSNLDCSVCLALYRRAKAAFLKAPRLTNGGRANDASHKGSTGN